MKKILFILLLAPFIIKAQIIQYLGAPNTRVVVRGQLATDSVQFVPLRTGINFTPSQAGAMIYRTSNSTFYGWNATTWFPFMGGNVTSTQIGYGNTSNLVTSTANLTYDSLNKMMAVNKGQSDSPAILIRQDYLGFKKWMAIEPPIKNDSTTEFAFWSSANPNDDNSISNHVVKFGSNIDFKQATTPAMWDAWESNWFEGGGRKVERHYVVQFNGGDEIRLASSTAHMRDSIGNSDNQWDFRGTFNLYSLQNQNYFGMSPGTNNKSFNMSINSLDNSIGFNFTADAQANPGAIGLAFHGVTQTTLSDWGTIFFGGDNTKLYLDATNDGLTNTIINQSVNIHRTGAYPVQLKFDGGNSIIGFDASGVGEMTYAVPASYHHNFYVGGNKVIDFTQNGPDKIAFMDNTDPLGNTPFRVRNDAGKLNQLSIYGTQVPAYGAILGGYSYVYGSAPAYVVMSDGGPLLFTAGGNVEGMRLNASSELQVGDVTDEGAFTFQNTGGLYQKGGTNYKVSTITTGTTTIDGTFYFIRCDASGGNITINLPAVSTVLVNGTGIIYIFKRMDNSGNTITINAAGSDRIDGSASTTLTTQYQVKKIMATATNEWSLSN